MRFSVAAVSVAAVMAFATSAASAGEITGNGTLKAVNGNSPCAYSGQEDLQWFTDDGDGTVRLDPTRGDPSHSQSWGQIVSGAGGHLGGANSTITPDGPWGCNAHEFGLKNP
jgi:streptogramin lyase